LQPFLYATTNRSVEIIDGTSNSDMASIASGNGDLVDVAVDQTTLRLCQSALLITKGTLK
jgi:hypothetical protein